MEFRTYRVLKRIWVAKKPRGCAFVDFDNHKDAQNVIRDLNGKHNWKVEFSHYYRGDGDRSDRDRNSGELDSDSDRHCSRTHLSDAGVQGSIPISLPL